MINESLARDQWPDQDPVGHTIEFGNMDGDLRLLTIVGIVGDTHEYGLDVPPRPTVYVNLFQRPRAAITLTMLSDADTRFGRFGSARNPAGPQPGDSGEVPDVFASPIPLRWARGHSTSFSSDSSESPRCCSQRQGCLA